MELDSGRLRPYTAGVPSLCHRALTLSLALLATGRALASGLAPTPDEAVVVTESRPVLGSLATVSVAGARPARAAVATSIGRNRPKAPT